MTNSTVIVAGKKTRRCICPASLTRAGQLENWVKYKKHTEISWIIWCKCCGVSWQSAAKYVDGLQDK